jgi:hypothetical protein
MIDVGDNPETQAADVMVLRFPDSVLITDDLHCFSRTLVTWHSSTSPTVKQVLIVKY